MIKIAFKHWIYEACINVLFDKIENNFRSVHKLIIGRTYNNLTIRGRGNVSGYILFNVEVIDFVNDIYKIRFRQVNTHYDNGKIGHLRKKIIWYIKNYDILRYE